MNDDTLLKIANEYETPVFVYDENKIREQYKKLKKYFKYENTKILYAMKANYNPYILKVLKEEGSMIDAVSFGDILMALKVGFSQNEILYTANNITDKEMEAIFDKGILFNIGSLSRLEKFGKAHSNEKVCLRFNPDVVAGENEKVQTGGDLTKFGILLKDLDKALAIVKKYNLKVVGLHEHAGSGIKETNLFLKAIENIIDIATKENFPDLEFIDFGGGFKVPYSDDEHEIDYSEIGEIVAKKFENISKEYGRSIAVYFEPGKYLVAQCGVLLVQVNTIKNNMGRNIVGVNSGFPQLIRPVLYNAYHKIKNLSNPKGVKKQYDICGNICESGDLFAKDREFSEIREGDILAIFNAGAYCYSMGGVYNLRAMPAEVMIRDGEAKLIRKALSSEELVNQILLECK